MAFAMIFAQGLQNNTGGFSKMLYTTAGLPFALLLSEASCTWANPQQETASREAVEFACLSAALVGMISTGRLIGCAPRSRFG